MEDKKLFTYDPSFTGRISSAEMNDIIKSMQTILTKIYNKSKDVKVYYDVLANIVSLTLSRLATKVTNMSSSINALSGIYTSMLNNGIASNIEILDSFYLAYDSNNITIDSGYNKIYLGYSSEEDSMLYNTSSNAITNTHKSTKIYVDNALIEDYSDPRVLFADGSTSTIALFSKTGSECNTAPFKIKLELGNAQPSINTLLFNIFPLPGPRIYNVKVDNTLYDIDTNYSALKILNHKIFNGLIEFYLTATCIEGSPTCTSAIAYFQLFKALYRNYYDTGYITYKISNANGIHNITSVSADYELLNDLSVPSYFRIQIATDDAFSNIIYDSNNSTFPLAYNQGIPTGAVNDIYIKVTLNKYEIYSPSFERIYVTYN